MYAGKFSKFIKRFGKYLVLRKQIGTSPSYGSEGSETWQDTVVFGVVQEVKAGNPLVVAGKLEVGDAEGYFPSLVEIEENNRVISNYEYIVDEVAGKEVGSEIVYRRCLLKRSHEPVSGTVGLGNLDFEDPF